MAKPQKIFIDVPQQGFSKQLTKEQLATFVRDEQTFYASLAPIFGDNYALNNQGFGALSIHNNASAELMRIGQGGANDDLNPLEAYIEAAKKCELVIGQGSIGIEIQGLATKNHRAEVCHRMALLCPRWLGNNQLRAALVPYRVAAFANPTLLQSVNLNKVSEAVALASEAQSESEDARAKLEEYIAGKERVFEQLEQVYREKLVLRLSTA